MYIAPDIGTEPWSRRAYAGPQAFLPILMHHITEDLHMLDPSKLRAAVHGLELLCIPYGSLAVLGDLVWLLEGSPSGSHTHGILDQSLVLRQPECPITKESN